MNIYNIDEQLVDLFEVSDSYTHQPPKNPLNLIWLLENCQPNSSQKKLVDDYYKKLKPKEATFNKTAQRTINKYNKLIDIVTDENLLCKRMDFLVQNGANIKHLGNKLVEYKSLVILKNAVALGLDINYEINDFYPLKTAIKFKANSISNYLYNLPTLDKEKMDSNGNTLIHLAALHKNLPILFDLSEKNMNSLFNLNKQNKTSVDMILKWKSLDNFSATNKAITQQLIFNLLNLHYQGDKLVSESILNSFRDSSEFKKLYTEYQYQHLNSKFALKEIKEPKKLKI